MATNTFMDTTALDYQFKRIYGNKITDLFKRHTMTYNQFDKSPRKAQIRPGGAGYYFSTRQKDVQGIRGQSESAILPEPLSGDGVQGYIKPKLIYGVIRMTGLAIEAGKGDAAAFIDAQGDATMNVYNALVEDLNRQCHGDGFGLLATVSTAGTPDTDTAGTWTITFDNDRGVRYLKPGMVVDFHSSSTAMDTSATSERIVSINRATNVVTFEGGIDTYAANHPVAAARDYNSTETAIAVGSICTRQGARLATHATTDTAYELAGLNALYDDGTAVAALHGITTSSDPEWKANLLTNSSVNRELSIDLMLAAVDMTAALASGGGVDLIRMGLGQRRKYYALLAPDIRFAPEVLKGGYGTLSFSQNGAIEMLFDPMTQPNRMYFEPKGAIKKYELKALGWGGFDANKMHWRPDYDQATMFLNTYTELGCENRPSLTLLDDLVEPSNTPY